jgi:uncharacterized SAM-binding protein YcdF (DUF218 family)
MNTLHALNVPILILCIIIILVGSCALVRGIWTQWREYRREAREAEKRKPTVRIPPNMYDRKGNLY